MKTKYNCRAPVAESVDALDLKSNRGSPSVPVQVWPGAITKRLTSGKSFFYASDIGSQDTLDAFLSAMMPNCWEFKAYL